MSQKIPQSQADLKNHFNEQLLFLEASAKSYDNGFEGEAKRLAAVIRTLVHDTKHSKSLLTQLRKKSIQFYDTAFDFNPNNLITHSGLVMIRTNSEGSLYIAMLDDGPLPPKIVKFDDWWNKIVFVDKERNPLTRKDLVLSVADQDGGTHVDPELNEVYGKLSRQNSLAWSFHNEKGEYPIKEPQLPAIRQVAHEVLKSLKPVLPQGMIEWLSFHSLVSNPHTNQQSQK